MAIQFSPEEILDPSDAAVRERERHRAQSEPPRYSRRDARHDPALVLAHVHFDISWDGVAKYVATREVTQRTAALINRHADRFLFGTDEIALSHQQQYLRAYRQDDPLWRALTPGAQALEKRGNYERLFDAARGRGNARTCRAPPGRR